jgi:hypothetical protein
MLAGVLLHVVESTAPVDLSVDRRALRERGTQHVHDVVAPVHGLDDIDGFESTDIKRLAS